jgi:hypothetical protein
MRQNSGRNALVEFEPPWLVYAGANDGVFLQGQLAHWLRASPQAQPARRHSKPERLVMEQKTRTGRSFAHLHLYLVTRYLFPVDIHPLRRKDVHPRLQPP